uniref:Uncharacterized protein n=1 Tax=Oryza meridionalis TaxID=40149 RepID=A0A0E0CLC4_9ORYZ
MPLFLLPLPQSQAYGQQKHQKLITAPPKSERCCSGEDSVLSVNCQIQEWNLGVRRYFEDFKVDNVDAEVYQQMADIHAKRSHMETMMGEMQLQELGKYLFSQFFQQFLKSLHLRTSIVTSVRLHEEWQARRQASAALLFYVSAAIAVLTPQLLPCITTIRFEFKGLYPEKFPSGL